MAGRLLAASGIALVGFVLFLVFGVVSGRLLSFRQAYYERHPPEGSRELKRWRSTDEGVRWAERWHLRFALAFLILSVFLCVASLVIAISS